MTNRLGWVANELEELDRLSLRRLLTTRESPPLAAMIQIDGRQFINFGSNDYLGIASSQELVLAVQYAASQVGVGAGASAMVNGRGTLHRKLETKIAEFEGRESALLFPSGFAANIGTISSLVDQQDVIFSDELNHASIIDGCRLSRAKTIVYSHSDMDDLVAKICQSTDFRRKLIVTDGLFSMDGDLAKLPSLCEIAKEYKAMLMVDEAHATGVLGENGKGTCEEFGVSDGVDIVVGTLSKALGTLGGFLVGSNSLIEYVFNRARSQVFSTALPEIIAASALAAFEIMMNEPDRRSKLQKSANRVREQLVDLGLDIGNSQSHIIPILIGSAEKTNSIASNFRKEGLFVPAIRPPSVPAGSSRLRISLASSHSPQHLQQLLNCAKSV